MYSDHFSGFTQRRTPIYFLLDCSGGMSGMPIVLVNEGLDLIYHELMNDPQTRDTAYISLIRFADTAAQDPFVPVDQFVPPTLNSSGRCSFGAAINLLVTSIEQDLVPTDQNKKGDYRPLVFLLTSGKPTDNWHQPLHHLNGMSGPLRPTIIALGCGDHVNMQTLAEVTDKVYSMENMTPELIKQYFKIISTSTISASRAASFGGEIHMPSSTAIEGIINYANDRYSATSVAIASPASIASQRGGLLDRVRRWLSALFARNNSP